MWTAATLPPVAHVPATSAHAGVPSGASIGVHIHMWG